MFKQLALLEETSTPEVFVVDRRLVWDEGPIRVVVPKGFLTDLASIPAPLRAVLSKTGRSVSPAILHDWLYNCKLFTRADTDAIFRRALISRGMNVASAWTYYFGVRIGGASAWRKDKHVEPEDFAEGGYIDWLLDDEDED